MGTKIGQLAQSLARTNPWWRNPDWAERDIDLRSASETGLGYRAGCLDNLEPGGLYILRGPRRVGKTVTLKQSIRDLMEQGVPPEAITFISADTASAEEIRTYVQNATLPRIPSENGRWWFFDEITAATGDWARQVKWLRDTDPDFARATIILTGSNAAELTRAAGVLAGRRGAISDSDRTLLPIGFRTFVKLLHRNPPAVPRLYLANLRTRQAQEAYDALIPWLDDLVRLWELYLQHGGFPRATAAARDGKPIPEAFIDDVFDVVFRDAFAAGHLSATATTALLDRLMQSISSPANLSAIATTIDVDQPVVARHVQYLRDAYLLWECPQKANKAWVARMRAQDKLYAIDPLIARLPYLRNNARTDVDVTALSEMQIGMALRRAGYAERYDWSGDGFLFYLRTQARKEIDFVAEPLHDCAIEGKYIESGKWRGEAATLLASEFNGIFVTRNVLDIDPDSRAWAVPAGVLCYVLDM